MEAAVCATPPASCVLCGARAAAPALRFDTRALVRCRACGLVWTDPMPSAAETRELEERAFRGELLAETRTMFAAYGRNYRPDDPVVGAFRGSLARMEALTRGRRLLDVGVGTGLYIALARERGWQAEGVEISAEAAARAAREFGVPVRPGRFEEVALDGPYDAITMGDVLEHTLDPPAFLRRAHELLAPGGVLYVAVPNFAGLVFRVAEAVGRLPAPPLTRLVERLHPVNHKWYFTPRTLPRLVEAAGLAVVHVEQEDPHLARYALGIPVRLGLRALLWLGRLAGRRNRLVVYGQRPGGGG